MSIFNGVIFSEALNMDTTVGVILPQDSRYSRDVVPKPEGVIKRDPPKTLILLHGLTDNWMAWSHRSRILNFAEQYGVAVLMPEVQRSFYQDMTYGEAYFTYITEELPELASKMFHISVEPCDLMVAGLSMGGYGALKCGLTYPERYSAVGAFSSATDMAEFASNMPIRKETRRYEYVLKGIFGTDLLVPDSARLELLALKSKGTKLPFMMTCGTEDELYDGNVKLYQQLSTLGYDVTFDAWPGVHEWGFWDTSIQMFLKRFV